ncbi:MAG: hypothetical protein RBG13Loki_2335 [Promethearchaeota archaeon CR_4]|nr:MAG: hypothetical protein RBG13Loki_2335 [Candidatus Lokiarchaeota archaeon CR_4]
MANKNPLSVGKIVNKEHFLGCDLIPVDVKDIMGNKGNYFLLIFVPREDLVKASFFPCNDAHIEKILIKLSEFSPELVKGISEVLKELTLAEHILHTTGLCFSSEACFYESYVHLSPEENISISAVKDAFSRVPKVIDVIIEPVPIEQNK